MLFKSVVPLQLEFGCNNETDVPSLKMLYINFFKCHIETFVGKSAFNR